MTCGIEPGPDRSLETPRRILLSAFACSPSWGSESGVGWKWLEVLMASHDVTLVTHAYFRSAIESGLTPAHRARVKVVYVDAPAFGMPFEKYLNSRLYYVWWQWRLRPVVRRLLASGSFDLIHHLTWGTVRLPSFLGRLGVPFVMGPLGGGESAPYALMKSLPWRERLFDAIRTATLRLARIDPLARWGPLRSDHVLCRTSETLQLLPQSARSRAGVAADIGAPPLDLSRRVARQAGTRAPWRLLFAGRLIGWKGAGLAIGALKHLDSLGIAATLDVAGTGPLRAFLEAKAARLGLAGRVRFLGSLPQEQLFDLYGESDLFVFPSLHDAGGSVVLEALSRGLPVVCLDLGGPKHYVDASCGAVIATAGLSEAELEPAIARAIAAICQGDGKLERLSAGAAERALQTTWAHQVHAAYLQISKALGWSGAAVGVPK